MRIYTTNTIMYKHINCLYLCFRNNGYIFAFNWNDATKSYKNNHLNAGLKSWRFSNENIYSIAFKLWATAKLRSKELFIDELNKWPPLKDSLSAVSFLLSIILWQVLITIENFNMFYAELTCTPPIWYTTLQLSLDNIISDSSGNANLWTWVMRRTMCAEYYIYRRLCYMK